MEEEAKPVLVNKFSSSMTMGAVVPLAILIAGAGIVIFISSILHSQSSYRDLVHDLNEKAFGNRWVAAYELSKVLANEKVPVDELPWLVAELISSYNSSQDERTRNFIVLALSTIKTKQATDFLTTLIDHENRDIRFHAMVALGNASHDLLPEGWQGKVLQAMKQYPQDTSLNVAGPMLFTQYAKAEENKNYINDLYALLSQNQNRYVQTALVTALFALEDERSLDYVRRIMLSNHQQLQIPEDQVQNLKLNLIKVAKNNPWPASKEIFQTALKAENAQHGEVVEIRLKELRDIL